MSRFNACLALFAATLAVVMIACSSGDAESPGQPSPLPTLRSGAFDEFEDIQLDVNGFTFDAVAAGPDDGELILMLHGFPQTSFEWRHQMPPLAEAGYRVVAPDQRGYSPAARPPSIESYSIGLLASDVFGMADELGYDVFHVVGHDWGAAVAWVVTMIDPERVASVSAVSVPHPAALAKALADPSGEQAGKSGYVAFFQSPESTSQLIADDAAFLRGIFAGAGLTDEEEQVYVDALGTEAAIDAALNWYRATDFSVGGVAPDVAVPSLFVWGMDDIAIGRQAAELGADYVSGPYRFEPLQDVGHWVPEESPELLTALLLEHLRSLDEG
jgi:pimeloyl-ACP methyl ester carboxylesterase